MYLNVSLTLKFFLLLHRMYSLRVLTNYQLLTLFLIRNVLGNSKTEQPSPLGLSQAPAVRKAPGEEKKKGKETE